MGIIPKSQIFFPGGCPVDLSESDSRYHSKKISKSAFFFLDDCFAPRYPPRLSVRNNGIMRVRSTLSVEVCAHDTNQNNSIRIALHCIALHCIALHCIALLAIFTGCAPRSTETEADVNALLATASTDQDSGAAGLGVTEHNFGSILARGQTLSHDFRLINHSRKTVRLSNATALTPCCSAVGPWPQSIPPGGESKFPIVLKSGLQTGRKYVRFVVDTDDPDHPTWWFAATANLFGEVEVIESNDSNHVLMLNHAGTLRFTVICRRLGKEGRLAPDSLSVAPPLSARFLGSAQNKRLGDGLIESRRSFEVVVPALKEPGSRASEIVLKWSDGRDFKRSFSWKANASLTATPSGFVLKSHEGRQTKTIFVRSLDRPFRLVGVSGPLLAEPPPPSDEPKDLHVLKLILDPSLSTSRDATEVIISTDHPDQPSLTLSVLVLHSSQQEDRP